jgi:hypothetical protein
MEPLKTYMLVGEAREKTFTQLIQNLVKQVDVLLHTIATELSQVLGNTFDGFRESRLL